MPSLNAFYIAPSAIRDGFVSITNKDQVHQIRKVLRLRVGDVFLALDGKGKEFECLVHTLDRGSVRGQIVATRFVDRETRIPITLYPSLIRRERFAILLSTCTELGVTSFVPVIAERSIFQTMTTNLVGRWNRVIQEAAEIVRRGVLPSLSIPQTLPGAIEQARGSDALTLVLSTHPTTTYTPVQVIEMVQAKGLARINIFIGPEGGYTAEELQQFDDAGIESLSLGPRKVRSETAAIVATSIIASLI